MIESIIVKFDLKILFFHLSTRINHSWRRPKHTILSLHYSLGLPKFKMHSFSLHYFENRKPTLLSPLFDERREDKGWRWLKCIVLVCLQKHTIFLKKEKEKYNNFNYWPNNTCTIRTVLVCLKKHTVLPINPFHQIRPQIELAH